MKSVLAILVNIVLLNGCDEDTLTVTGVSPEGPSVTVPETPDPELPEITRPTHFSAVIKSGSKVITGDVTCNDERLNHDGRVELAYDDPISCLYGNVTLAEFSPIWSQQPHMEDTRSGEQFHELNIEKSNATETERAQAILNKIDACSNQESLCLNEIDSFDIELVYANLNNKDLVEDFLEPKPEDNVGEAPSSHVDNTVVPEVSSGTNDSSFGNPDAFVSANVEQSLSYKPDADNAVATTVRLVDDLGRTIEGVQFYTKSKQGITDSAGQFEFIWGEDITFGIDTFTFGSTKGNQIEYRLSDVTSNAMVKQNIQHIVERYATDHHNEHVEFSPQVHEVFALYPNVINAAINLALPNGAPLLNDKGQESGFVTPDEFKAQFGSGIAALIDAELKQIGAFRYGDYFTQPKALEIKSGSYVSDTLKALYHGVDQFHVFHDSYSWYGASGEARGTRALNLSNRAFPITMARNDNSHWLPLEQEAAWTRGSGTDKKAYFVDATVLDASSTVTLQRPMVLKKDNVTFDLPFVTAGELGRGHVVYLGNTMYTSVLSCPDNYWAGAELQIDSQSQACSYRTGAEAQLADSRNDRGSMKQFFTNLFQWLEPNYQGKSLATNIELGHAFEVWKKDKTYPFFVDSSFGFSELIHYSSQQFDGLNPETTPFVVLQGYEQITDGYDTKSTHANIDAPKLNQDDLNDLMGYVSKGGNLIFMEAVMPRNPEPIARLFDAAGMVVGGANTVITRQAYCGNSYWCGDIVPNLHAQTKQGLVVYERYDDTSKITIGQNGSISWPGPVDMPKLSIPRFKDENGEQNGRYAFFEVANEQEKLDAIAQIQSQFPSVPVCKDDYQYEVNCIEYREGHGIETRGNYARPDFTRLPINGDVVGAMVKAANLGDNVMALFNHELYYRTKAELGTRLPAAELNAVYDNLSIWLWNDEQYRFEGEHQDELGFKVITQFLNCYTNNKHGGGTNCPESLKDVLVKNNMRHANGELNPSYPLNYMEKPLTRLMLGRSFWDFDITVDTTEYPGRPSTSGSTASVVLETYRKPVTYTASNRQATGLWAPQLQTVTLRDGVPATITVALVDDLTGRHNHEQALNRPPRVEMSFKHDGISTDITVPYGGLIYVTPQASDVLGSATFNFSNVLKASYWKEGVWVHPYNEDVPLADIDTGHFLYTTPVKNLSNSENITDFAQQMNRFADAASDFYGRDETPATDQNQGLHRRFTYAELPQHRHHFVNDRQISIGAAHSGYPVQSSSFNVNATNVPTKPEDDWLLWHEVGHNLAAAPFSVAGSTEVTNNILALYMQEMREANPTMTRIEGDIKKIPMWMSAHRGHAWSEGDAGLRLVMFGQLKLWAQDNFAIHKWYLDEAKPSVFKQDEGWNMYKLMHRMARGETFHSDQNYCTTQATGLNASDTLMVCASYASGFDLSDFFLQWNPGEVKADMPDGTSDYSGGITGNGVAMVKGMNLPLPTKSPLDYTTIH
ncbi:SslE/AcfD family lipoprotein zinc metalloprotease [Vibrio taketomensis]|uniref:SslE/AcfD family lipoprotein zinc metalloprotease n=1 Tax=Vibrio taketomensis TaxID=2572923 RepID=UPI00138A1DCD|nr:SslE/AcfD family lipoprotein zinc metalloprotease [Vibrio taketomensis]